jgi:hypothetical protein
VVWGAGSGLLLVKERINAVQRVFYALLIVDLVVIAIGIPMPGDGASLDVLDEVTSFEAGFDRGQLEKTLLAHAQAQGVIALDAVAAAAKSEGVPQVHAAAGSKPLAPRASLALATLGDVYALTGKDASLKLGMASADALGRSLAWRLSRRSGAQSFELQSVTLSDQGCSDADLQRERDVTFARIDLLRARRELAMATKTHEDAEKLTEQRKKWHAPWKSIMKANEKRLEVLAIKEKADKTLHDADARYEQLAKQSEQAKPANNPGCALANIELREQPSGQRVQLTVPAAVESRPVPVGSVTGADFPIAHASGLWDELAKLSPKAAIAKLRSRFSWHYRYVEVANGVKLGGMTVLQLAPLMLLPFFFALIRRSRGVGASYNPFDRPPGETLPMVGFGLSALNLLVLLFLPLAGCALCTWSLIELKQLPVVPVLCVLGCVGLGGSSQFALGELLELREAVTRSHSNPPAAPAR